MYLPTINRYNSYLPFFIRLEALIFSKKVIHGTRVALSLSTIVGQYYTWRLRPTLGSKIPLEGEILERRRGQDWTRERDIWRHG